MSKRVTIAKVGAAALASVIALATALPAGAQSSSSSYQPEPSYQGSGSYTAQSPNGYYYDPCKRDQTQRGTVGALLGGTAGAVIGSNVAARNARPEGAILGGVLGAIAGGVVGNKSAACQSGDQYAPPPPPPPPRSTDNTYYRHDSYRDRGDRYSSRYADDAYAYDNRGARYPIAQDRAPDASGCTLAESPIYMPDGRTQTRFVRVCRDASGHYAVVD